MAALNPQDIPRDIRPAGDGRFLLRYWRRDYVLTEEQVLEFGRLARNAGRMRGTLALIPVLILIVAPLLLGNEAFDRIGLPWQMAATLVLFIPLLFGMFRDHRRTLAALDRCDFREVPKADGIAARWVQKLEYDRSVNLHNDDTSSGRLMIGVVVLVIGTLVMVFANSPYTVTVRAALLEMFSLDSETIKVIGLAVMLPAMAVLIYFVSRGIAANNLKEVPPEARPTGDGHFLYRFRGRDYVLTREQAIRHRQRFWDPINVWLVLVVVLLVIAPEIAADFEIMLRTGFFVAFLAWVLGRRWLAMARLKDCDFRDVPKARGLVARGLQSLEYYRSIYLRDEPSPILLALYCLAGPVGFGVLVMGPWYSLTDYDGLEFLIDAGLLIALFATCLVLFAVPFYALCRTIVERRAGTSGPEKPPTD